MSEYSAKTLREKAKARARALANPGSYAKDQEVSSADWSPAEPLNADVKTGARPVGKGARLYKRGGKVAGSPSKARADRKPRATGGRAVEKEIGIGMANKDVRAANEQREGKKHIGAFKKGGRTKKNIGGVLEKISPAYAAMRSIQRGSDEEQQTKDRLQQAAMMNAARGAKKGGKIVKKAGGATSIPTDKETRTNKDRIGSEKIKPVRASAQHYKKGGKIKKAGGGSFLEKIVGKPKTGSDMSQVGKMGSARYPTEEKETMKEIISPRDTTKETVETMERLGEAGRKKGGRAERKAGGRAKGKGKTNINIVINAGKKGGPEMPPLDMGAGMPSAPMMPPPGLPPGPGPAAPPPAGLPMGGMPGAPVPGMNTGGRAKKFFGGPMMGKGRMPQNGLPFGRPGPFNQPSPFPAAGQLGQMPPQSGGFAKGTTGAPPMGSMNQLGNMPPGMNQLGNMPQGQQMQQLPPEALAMMQRGQQMAQSPQGSVNSGAPRQAGPNQDFANALQQMQRMQQMQQGLTPGQMGPSQQAQQALFNPAIGFSGQQSQAPQMQQGIVQPPAQPRMVGRKAGGRITKIAKSYKDMEAGAASGEGRLQKTDIEKRHADAPARKAGGRISKIAKSFKDMTAGAGDGEGRLQKMDIAKFKRARSK
jgi:hypothetical protein